MLLLGALALLGVGLATGLFNATLIRLFRLPSIIATLGTLSILEGASLLLRDHPEGPINSDVIDVLTTSCRLRPDRVHRGRRPRRARAMGGSTVRARG